MKVRGSAVLHAPRERVWQAFKDPEILVRTIPGCERLETIGTDHYRMTVQAGVASIRGTFAGEVSLHDHEEPGAFVMSAKGAGAPGTIQTDVTVTLAADGDTATRLDYAADAVVGGTIGGVGQRVLAGAAKRTAEEFFRAVDDVLTGAVEAGGAPEVAAEAAGAPQVAGAPPTAVPSGQAYLAPAKQRPARDEFARGALVGAGIALLGALVGGWAAGRRRV
jgi:uncharacterized protein